MIGLTMKTVETTYICDLCGKTVERGDIKRASVPALVFEENEWGTLSDGEYKNVALDLCEECIKKVTMVRFVNGFYRELVPGEDIRLLTKEEVDKMSTN